MRNHSYVSLTALTPRQSNHSVFRLFRPKGEKWSALACFLAENMAILDIQYLKLQAFDLPGGEPVVAPPHAFVAEMEKLFDTDLPLSERQVEDIVTRNNARLASREYRNSEKGKETRAAGKRKSRTSQAAQRKETGKAAYVSGGGAAAAAADDIAVRMLEEKKWCGEDWAPDGDSETKVEPEGYEMLDTEQRPKDMMEPEPESDAGPEDDNVEPEGKDGKTAKIA